MEDEKIMNICCLLAGLAGVVCMVENTTGQVQVVDVVVTGNRKISTDRIRSFIKVSAGDQYSREQLKDRLREHVESLSATHEFKYVVTKTRKLPDGRIK